MRAVTLWSPWSHAVVHGSKDVENRKALLPPPELLAEIRPFFAIHAGLSYGMLGFSFPEGAQVPPREECAAGAIIGVARVLGALDMRRPQPRVLGPTPEAASMRSPEYMRILDMDQRSWWLGPIGWLLADRIAIDPIPCKGHLGCWTVPPDIEARIMDVLARR